MNTSKSSNWMHWVLAAGLALQVQVLTGADALLSAATNISDLVTINVDNGPIAQVLNAFSRQTGRSIVIGPEVTGNVTLRLTEKPWQDALDVILRPYGFDHYIVGDTIIICGADKMPKSMTTNKVAIGTTLVGVAQKVAEPLEVEVISLKYLDASDVEEIIRSQLSPAGKIGKLVTRSQSWKEQAALTGNQSTSSESLGRLQRLQEDSGQVRGKTLVLVDTAEVIKRVRGILDKIDKKTAQVQIEARFVEVSANLLRDIGVEWGTGLDGSGTPIGSIGGEHLYAAGARQTSRGVKPDSFKPQSSTLAGTAPFNAGLSLAFQKLTDMQFAVLLHLLEEDASFKMLSSPKVMTMDNQDAVILVGQKLPIINSTIGSGDTAGTTKTTTALERYEDIGIKLKVMPQVCEDNTINLIVHPSVRELLGYQSGNAAPTENTLSEGAAYPIIATREAETQVLIKSGQTLVIGGMIREKKQDTQIKVPFLGSIPLLGVLFRRDTVNTEKIELLIFLTATIRDTTDALSVKLPESQPLIKVENAGTLESARP